MIREGKKDVRVDAPFRVSLPFTDQITRTDTKERALGFRCDGFREVGFTSTWWTIQEDTSPRRALSREKVREFNGKNDSFLQGSFGALKTGDVVPLHVGFLGEDGTRKARTEFLEFGILIFVAIFPFATDCTCAAVGAHCPTRSRLVLGLDVLLQRFGARQILVNLDSDQNLGLFVLFICGNVSGKETGSARGRTFLSEHEIIEGVHVLFVRFGVVLLDIFVNGALDNFDSFLTGSVRYGRLHRNGTAYVQVRLT